MVPAREIRVDVDADYFLSLPLGALHRWVRTDDPAMVPMNEAARAPADAAPPPGGHGPVVQVIVIGGARKLALVTAGAELPEPMRARAREVLAKDLPGATPVFCTNLGPGAEVAVSAAREGEATPEVEEIAACVAVMKAGYGWDETPVMTIEADGVRCRVEMYVGGEVGCVRVSRAG
jgi:hypothetical protein